MHSSSATTCASQLSQISFIFSPAHTVSALPPDDDDIWILSLLPFHVFSISIFYNYLRQSIPIPLRQFIPCFSGGNWIEESLHFLVRIIWPTKSGSLREIPSQENTATDSCGEAVGRGRTWSCRVGGGWSWGAAVGAALCSSELGGYDGTDRPSLCKWVVNGSWMVLNQYI